MPTKLQKEKWRNAVNTPVSGLQAEKTASLGHQLAQTARTRVRNKTLSVVFSTLLAMGAGGFLWDNYQGGVDKKGQPTLKAKKEDLIRAITESNIPANEQLILIKFVNDPQSFKDNPNSNSSKMLRAIITKHGLNHNTALKEIAEESPSKKK